MFELFVDECDFFMDACGRVLLFCGWVRVIAMDVTFLWVFGRVWTSLGGNRWVCNLKLNKKTSLQ